MPDFSIIFKEVTDATAREIHAAVAHAYGVEPTTAGVTQAVALNFIRPVLDSYRQRRVDVDLAKPAADFGPDLGDPE
jgi:hypothetical protein